MIIFNIKRAELLEDSVDCIRFKHTEKTLYDINLKIYIIHFTDTDEYYEVINTASGFSMINGKIIYENTAYYLKQTTFAPISFLEEKE